MQPPTDPPVAPGFPPNSPADAAPRTRETTGAPSSSRAPPRQTYTPGQHNYSPYPVASSRPRRSLGATDTTSQPSIPVEEPGTLEMEKMRKEINLVAKIFGVVWMTVNAFSDNNIQPDQILDYLNDVTDKGVSSLRILRVCSRIVTEQVQIIFDADF